MILYVTRTLDIRGVGAAALEFVEELAIGLAHHIDQYVEAAAMGHAHHDLTHAQLAAALDDLFQRRNSGFAAIQTEALGADETGGSKLLEAFGLDQLVEDRLFAFGSEADLAILTLDAALQPGLLLGVVDVEEFIADGAAIEATQLFENFARRGRVETQHAIDEHGVVESGAGEAVLGGIKRRLRRLRRDAERIEIGLEMADHPVSADHLHRMDRLLGRFLRACGVGGPTSNCFGAFRVSLIRRGRRGLAGQGKGGVVTGQCGALAARPGRALAQLRCGQIAFAQAGEIILPGRIDGIGIGEIALIELLDEGGIGAGEEAGGLQNVVGGAAERVFGRFFSHFKRLKRSLLGSAYPGVAL